MVSIEVMVHLQRHIFFSDILRSMEGKRLKRILMFLYCANYNEINICHSDIQKHGSFKNGIKM